MLKASTTTDRRAHRPSVASAISPVALRDLELSQPCAPIVLDDECAGLRVLVRIDGRPVGQLRFVRPGREVTPAQLRAALDAQLDSAVLRCAWREQLDDRAPHSAPQPAISVVVCTRDRTASLESCLDALLAIDYPQFEVIVVDNAPTSESTAALMQQRIAQRAGSPLHGSPDLRYVLEPQAGLDWARNSGMREAKHDIIAYTDDDVCVDTGWLRGIARGFRDPDVRLVTGLVVPGELDTDAQVIFEDYCSGMGKGMSPRVIIADASLTAGQRLGVHHLGVGANMAFRREWLQQLGGFDTALDVGTASHGGGDLDIFHRTLLAGGTARYEPRAFVRHYHRREMPALRLQLRDNGRAFGVYLLSRWSMHERPRAPVMQFAIGTWLPWLAGRAIRRLLGRDELPIALQAEEWRGLIAAPFAWRATYANDRRRRTNDAPPVQVPVG